MVIMRDSDGNDNGNFYDDDDSESRSSHGDDNDVSGDDGLTMRGLL